MEKHEITKKIAIISDLLKINQEDVTSDSTFQSLGADSLDSAEVVMKIENEFGIQIPDNNSRALNTVGSLADYVEIALKEKK